MLVKGAHAAPLVRAPTFSNTRPSCSKQIIMIIKFLMDKKIQCSPGRSMYALSLFIVLLSHLAPATIGLTPETEALLKFKASLANADDTALSKWSDKTTPCSKGAEDENWVGVICGEGSVRGLQLEDMGLMGKIDVEALKGLPDLRSLSLMKNSFEGPLPDFNKLPGLRSLFLSDNNFSGAIPDDAFLGMKLKKLYLAFNSFKGPIPSSLSSLARLSVLSLEGNQFTGRIPEFKQEFQSFNVSKNALQGPIPAALAKTDPSSFSGNEGLCGEPLKNVCDTAAPAAPAADKAALKSSTDEVTNVSKSSGGLASAVIVAIIAGIAVLAIVGVIFVLLRRKKPSPDSIENGPQQPSDLGKKSGFRESEHGHSSPRALVGGNKKPPAEATKLSFVRDDRETFDLPDLLKASAEILGSGSFGSSYKASPPSGRAMVVKRFKQMNNVGKEEFQEHMRRLGRLRHPNVLPLVAYYYRKEEKLLITDYVPGGSLAVHLHGHRAVGKPTLDWPTRLKIVKGVAKGLAYLSKELPGVTTAHGHLKSSNVLVNESNEPVLTDYGLVPVINQENSRELMVAYKSPEYLHLSRITKKTDVWSLGILIMEILTGRFPSNFLQQGKGNAEEDIAGWVTSVPRENWAAEVLDKELVALQGGGESEMIKLLKIAVDCCEADLEKRLDLKEALERIDDIKDKDGGGGDEDFYSSYASEADIKSSRGTSDDFNFS
ncbi:hypothetical protein Tsubulata_023617 [Turnera subulata]|uniref:Protein kinase domain-containing protein n=1 Tax=Turnera subulata TaxID=218843 RepID=A0A9Q0J4V9_9ROSI|nr:hypothetical protein Tsubulata_023617 [Turnera subulata]